jgi:predicted metalloprotease
MSAASAVGDDRIQQQSGQRVNVDAFTHGSAQQRMEWFGRGFQSGDLKSCDTFA